MIMKLRLALQEYRNNRRLLILFLLLSILEQGVPIVAVFLTAKAFAIHLSFSWAIITVPLVVVISRIPISIDGWGIQEGAFVYVFTHAGLSVNESLLLALAGRMLVLLAALPGAFWLSAKSAENRIAVERTAKTFPQQAVK